MLAPVPTLPSGRHREPGRGDYGPVGVTPHARARRAPAATRARRELARSIARISAEVRSESRAIDAWVCGVGSPSRPNRRLMTWRVRDPARPVDRGAHRLLLEADRDLFAASGPAQGHPLQVRESVFVARSAAGRGSSRRAKPARARARRSAGTPAASASASIVGSRPSRAASWMCAHASRARARSPGPAGGSCANDATAPDRSPAGSRASRRSRSGSLCANRTSRPRGSARASPPGSGRAARGPSADRRRAIDTTRRRLLVINCSLATRSPRSMRCASSISSAAVSSRWRPAPVRN